MNGRLPTLTIGIPAYNEEGNMKYLLADILKQNTDTYKLESIIVASDASTDNTDAIVKSFKNKKVRLISNRIRHGQGAKQNQIIEACNSDILVLLNADILVEGIDFIRELIHPIINGFDVACGQLLEIKPTSFFEKLLIIGSTYKRRVFEKYKNGNNIFTCHGSHRAFSRRFYKDFRFKGSIAEDAYSYLYCIKNNYRYEYTTKAKAYIRVPSDFCDHVHQSTRFFKSNDKLANSFDKNFIKENTKWPIMIFISEGIKLFIEYPIESIMYALVSIYVMIRAKLGLCEGEETWKMVTSSKILRN